MSSEAWRRALRTWVSSVYWTGALVADTAVTSQHKFDWRWVKTRAWNAACLTAVVYRIGVETWPATLQATRQTEASCYDTVCGGVWCVYACVYYAVSWLDRTSEVAALVAAVTWRRRATVECMNWVTTGRLGRGDGDDKGIDNDTIVHDDDDACERLSVADVPWHAYLTVAFPVVQLVVAAAGISPRRDDAWRSVTAAVAAVASCAPVAAHGTAAALLAVANSNMRSINSRIIALVSACRHRDPRNDIARLARSHWWTTEFVTGGVCNAYSADLMAAVLLAAVRVTYVAISVFHRLTDEADAEDNARTNMSLAVVMQLIAWFGQFAYLAYTCDQLTTQSYDMFDNLNSLLMGIFKQSRQKQETYSSRMQEIEAVQEFMRQVAARKIAVHACGGLITLNLSLITTIIGITLTYFIVLLQFESSHGNGIHNNTITQ